MMYSLDNCLRFLSTLWPILQDIAHHIQDKLAISFDSSSIGLIGYKWFLTICDKYSSVKTLNEEDSIFLEKKYLFKIFQIHHLHVYFDFIPLLIYEGRSKILQVHFFLTPSAQTWEKSHHVSINVTLIIQGLFLADFIAVIRLYSQCQKVSFFPNFRRKIPNFKS